MSPVVLRNHTPHPVMIVLADGTSVTLPSCPPTPRCDIRREDAGTVQTTAGPVPLTRTTRMPEVTDLPPGEAGVLLVVAHAVAEACPDRTDFVFPDRQIRDEQGRVVACSALGRLAPG